MKSLENLTNPLFFPKSTLLNGILQNSCCLTFGEKRSSSNNENKEFCYGNGKHSYVTLRNQGKH